MPGELAALADLRDPVVRGGGPAGGHGHDRVVDVRPDRTERMAGVRAARPAVLLRDDRRRADAGDAGGPGGNRGGDLHGPCAGTLAHMLATDLSDPEIVLGKLAARLLPVLGLVACSWPVLAISSLLGGIDPTALTLAFAVILAVALLGCTMAMALSVWARKPHEVVLVTYTFWMFVLLLWPIWFGLSKGGLMSPPQWTLVADPFYLAFAPYSVPGKLGLGDYLGFFAATLGASCLLTVLAVRRMRPVAARGVRRPSQGAGTRPAGPAAPVAPRPAARRQPGTLARMAPLAAVALDDGSPAPGGRDDHHRLHHRVRDLLAPGR